MKNLTRIFLSLILFISHGSVAICCCSDREPENLYVHFIDVGYGDANLIQFPDETTLLIDAGDQVHSKQLWEYLKELGVNWIDTAIITHPHKDHFGGFFILNEKIPIMRVFVNGDPQGENGYSKLLEEFKDKEIPIKVLKQGDTIDTLPPSIRINVLHPQDLEGSPNGNSMVLYLRYNDVTILFAADIEKKQQKELILNYPFLKDTDCVKVPHHGRSLSNEFIENFKRAIYIVSVGEERDGMPMEIMDDNSDQLQGTVYRTDSSGTIVFESDGMEIERISR